MRDAQDDDFGSQVRRTWHALVAEILPRAAIDRDWPVWTQAGFERVLLDHVRGLSGETAVGRRRCDEPELFDLILGIEMAGRMIAGTADVATLNRRSLEMRAGSPADASSLTADGDDAPSEERLSDTMRRLFSDAAPRRNKDRPR